MGLSTATANLGRAVARVQDLALRTILRKTGGAICSQAIEDGIRIFEACAINEGSEYQPFIRTGYHGDKRYRFY